MDAIKRSFIRTAQTIKTKVGASEKYTDADYESITTIFEQQEKVANNFQKHFHQMSDLEIQFARLFQHIAEDYQQAYAEAAGSKNLEVSEQMIQLAEQIESQCAAPLKSKLQTQCVEPVTQFSSEFARIKSLQQKRKQKRLDFEYARDRYKTISSKTNVNADQLHAAKEALDKSRDEFDVADTQLKQAMQNVNDMRFDLYHNLVKDSVVDAWVEFFDKMKPMVEKMRKLKQISHPPKAFSKQFNFEEEEDIQCSQESAPIPSTYSSKMNTASAPVLPPKTSPRAVPTPLSNTSSVSAHRSAMPPPPVPRKAMDQHPPPEIAGKMWYYLSEDLQQQGPVPYKDLKQMYEKGKVNRSTHVFCDGMGDWESISKLPTLLQYISI